jgi:hypothetical protein
MIVWPLGAAATGRIAVVEPAGRKIYFLFVDCTQETTRFVLAGESIEYRFVWRFPRESIILRGKHVWFWSS